MLIFNLFQNIIFGQKFSVENFIKNLNKRELEINLIIFKTLSLIAFDLRMLFFQKFVFFLVPKFRLFL